MYFHGARNRPAVGCLPFAELVDGLEIGRSEGRLKRSRSISTDLLHPVGMRRLVENVAQKNIRIP